MDSSLTKILLYSISILQITTKAQVINKEPVNTAVKEGSNARLDCTAEIGSDVLQWRHTLNYTDSLIWSSDDEDVIHDDRFEVIRDQTNQYDLIVKDSTAFEGGMYYVRLVNTVIDKSAQLTVLSGLACSPSEERSTQEGAALVVICDTSFYGFHRPSMSVYYNGQKMSSWTYVNEEGDFTSETMNFTARPEHDRTKYECRLKFEGVDGDTSKQPEYTESCITASYNVYFAVQNVTITPSAPEGEILQVELGESLNCSGIGKEPPDFDWYCQDLSYIVEGPILPITEALLGEQKCICRAYNLVMGQLKEVRTNITFYTYKSGQPMVTAHAHYSLLFLTAVAIWNVM